MMQCNVCPFYCTPFRRARSTTTQLWSPSYVLVSAGVAGGCLALAHALVDAPWRGRAAAARVFEPLA